MSNTSANLSHQIELEGSHCANYLSLHGVSRAIAAASTSHATELNIAKGFDPRRNCGWIVLGLRMRVCISLPVESAMMTCRTWITNPDGPTLTREFELLSNDKTIAIATQNFALFDRERRRLMIPPKSARDYLQGIKRQHTYGVDVARQPLPAFLNSGSNSLQRFGQFQVGKSDIDDNNHLNNSVYLRRLEEVASINSNSSIEIAIEYLNEAVLGDEVTLRTSSIGSSTCFEFLNATKTYAHGIFQILK